MAGSVVRVLTATVDRMLAAQAEIEGYSAADRRSGVSPLQNADPVATGGTCGCPI